MRNLIFIFLLLASTSGRATGVCPDDFKSFKNANKTIGLLKALNPLKIESSESDNCAPKTFSTIAFGIPLCLFGEEVPAMTAGFSALVDTEEIISYGYYFKYSTAVHEKLLSILKKQYSELLPSEYPDRYKTLPVHQEVTALFKFGDALIALGKPSEGMPGPWISSVGFETLKHIDINHRDSNTCR
ncbi:MAG TPA: hypothetical protein VJ654_01145 [Noviherbaspirillum sp.]|nr:hypothetical protein [Noviherbaspirillum sp.]